MNRDKIQGGKHFGELKARQDSYLDALNRDILANEDFKYIHLPSLKERLDIFKKKFMEFDADHSGDIDFFELKQMLEQLGQPRTHLEAKKLLKDTDKDGRGAINYREFVDLLLGDTLGAGILFAEELELEMNMNNPSPAQPKKKRQAPKPPGPALVKPKKVTFKTPQQDSLQNEIKERIQHRAVMTVQSPKDRSFKNELQERSEEQLATNAIAENVDPSGESVVMPSDHSVVMGTEIDEATQFENDSADDDELPRDPPPYEETTRGSHLPPVTRERRQIPVIATEVLPRSTQSAVDPGPNTNSTFATTVQPAENAQGGNGNSISNTDVTPNSVSTRPSIPVGANTASLQPGAAVTPNTVQPRFPVTSSTASRAPHPTNPMSVHATRSNLPAPVVYPYHYPAYQATTAGVPAYIQPCNIPGCIQCPNVYPSSYQAAAPQATYQITPQLIPTQVGAQMVAYPAGYIPQVTSQVTYGPTGYQHPQGHQGHQQPGHQLADSMASMALR